MIRARSHNKLRIYELIYVKYPEEANAQKEKDVWLHGDGRWEEQEMTNKGQGFLLGRIKMF